MTIHEANSIQIDSLFKCKVVFEASGAHFLVCVWFINCFREEGSSAKKGRGGIPLSLNRI